MEGIQIFSQHIFNTILKEKEKRKMKEKGSKGPQKWHLRQPQLFHTDVNKLPPMADTLSFN